MRPFLKLLTFLALLGCCACADEDPPEVTSTHFKSFDTLAPPYGFRTTRTVEEFGSGKTRTTDDVMIFVLQPDGSYKYVGTKTKTY